MIFYFSGTGNTRWAAQRLAAALHEDLINIAPYMRMDESSQDIAEVEPLSAYRVAGADAAHQNYNATRSAVQKYCDFLSAVAACEEYFGDKYDFDACRLAGTFFPYWNRIHDGGLNEFRAAMRQHLPASARRRWPGYFAARSAKLAAASLKRRLHHG